MRRILALLATLAISFGSVIALEISPAHATGLPDGTYDCNTGNATGLSPNFTVTAGVVSAGTSCTGALVIPEGVTSIGDNAFSSSSVTSVAVGATLTSISSTAFRLNSNLSSISFAGKIPSGWPWSAPAGVRVSGQVDCGTTGYFVIMENIVYARHDCTGSVVIPQGVTEIAAQAFDADPYWGGFGYYGNWASSTVPTNITSLTIPSTVTAIGDYAFRSLRASTLTIPDSVVSIGHDAFLGSSMSTLIIGNGVTAIPDWGFAFLTNLQHLTLGTGIKKIGDAAFRNASNLTSLDVPSDVASIGAEAFYSTTALSTLHLNEGLTSIGRDAFNSSWSLHSFTIPDSVEYIGSNAFAGVDGYQGGNPTVNFCGNASLAGSGLPNPSSNASSCVPAPLLDLTAMPGNGSATLLFTPGASGSSALTNYKYSLDGVSYTLLSPAVTTSPITISGLTNGTAYRIYLKAVSAAGDSSPVSVRVFPRLTGQVAVPADGTYNCNTGLPSSATPNYTITNGSVHDGGSCVGAVVVANGATSLGYWAFGYGASVTSVYIPETVTSIQDYAFANSPLLFAINVASANQNFSSVNGVLFDKARTTLIKYPEGKRGSSYSVLSGVTRIESFSFYKTYVLTSVTIPSSVRSIGTRAFSLSGLTSVVIPEGVTSIEDNAFNGSLNLATVSLPSTLTSIGSGIFAENYALSSINIPSGITQIPNRAFYYDSALTSITLPQGVTSIGEEAFTCATGLANINFPAGLQTIGPVSFACTALTSIVLPEGVTTVGHHAFQSDTLVSTLSLPESLRTIGEAAFYNLPLITNLTIPDGVETIGNVAFSYLGSPLTLAYCGNASLVGTGLQSATTNTSTCRPAPPMSVSATAGIGSATLSFTPGAAGGASINKYQYSLDGSSYSDFSTPVTNYSATLTGLTNGTSYTVYLRAVSSIGNGAPSTPVTFTPLNAAYTTPSVSGIIAPVSGATPVTSVSATSRYTGTVTWSGGNPSTFAPGTSYTATITLSPNTGYTFDGVSANYFSVSGATSVSNDANSSVITAVFPATGDVPGAPTNVVATRTGSTTATVTFVPPASDGGSAITGYSITAYGDSMATVTTSANNHTANFTGLLSTSDYGFLVVAINSAGTSVGAWSNVIAPAAYDPGTGTGSVACVTDGQTAGVGYFMVEDHVVIYSADDCQGAVVIPAGVTEIAPYVFESLTGITSIAIPGSVLTIGVQAFSGLDQVTTLTIAAGVTTIGDEAFLGLSSLEELVIPDSVTTLGEGAFQGLSHLTSLRIGNGITAIPNFAFMGLTLLEELAIPDSVTTIGLASFYQAEHLTEVLLPEALTNIGVAAFGDSPRITWVSIPASVTSVGDYAFGGAAGLETVYFFGNAPTVAGGDIPFDSVRAGAEAVVSQDATDFTEPTWQGLNVRRVANVQHPVVNHQQQQSGNQQQQQSPPVAATHAPLPKVESRERQRVSTNGQTLTLEGSNLDDVRSITINGKEAKINKKSSGQLVIQVPASSVGFPEVVITSAAGVVTLQGLIQVVAPYSDKRTAKVTATKNGQLTSASLAALKKSYKSAPPANVISCSATVASNASSKDVALARKSAKATCEAMVEFSSYINTVNVQVSKTGRAGSKLALAVTFDRTLTGK